MVRPFREFYAQRNMLEHAWYQRNIYKLPYIFNQDDLEFLQQFPPAYWVEALKWRFEEGLLQVAEAWEKQIGSKISNKRTITQEDIKKLYETFDYPEKQDVVLRIWTHADKETKRAHFSNIKTGLKKLYWKLQEEVPTGLYDYDLTEPSRAVDDSGQPLDVQDPPHRFNATWLTLQNQSARRNLNTWAKMMELGLLGAPPQGASTSEISFGKPRGEGTGRAAGRAGKSNSFKLPTIKVKLPSYKVEELGARDGGKTTNVPAGEYSMPVLNDGALIAKIGEDGEITAPFKVKNEGAIKKALRVADKDRNDLIGIPLIDETDGRSVPQLKQLIRSLREPLGLGDKYIEKLDGLIDYAATHKSEISVQHLIRATNPKLPVDTWRSKLYPGRETASDSFENLLSNFELLSPERQEILRNSRISSKDLVERIGTGENLSHMDWWLGGGFKPQREQTPREKKREIEKIFGNEQVRSQAFMHYLQLANGQLRHLVLQAGEGSVDKRLYLANGEDWANKSAGALMLMGNDPEVGWSPDQKENSTRDNQRKAFLTKNMRNYLRIAKIEAGGGAESTDAPVGTEGDSDKGSLVSGKGDISGQRPTSLVGKRRYRRRTGAGSSIGEERELIENDVLRRMAIVGNLDALVGIYKSLKQRFMQSRGRDPRQDTNAAEDYAIQNTQAEAQKAGIVLNMTPERFIETFRNLIKQYESGITTVDVDENDYQPFKPAETEEEQEIEEIGTDQLRTLATTGKLKLRGMQIDLSTVNQKTADAVLPQLRDYFASKFVPKDEFDRYWPMVMRHISNVPKKTVATSPTVPVTRSVSEPPSSPTTQSAQDARATQTVAPVQPSIALRAIRTVYNIVQSGNVAQAIQVLTLKPGEKGPNGARNIEYSYETIKDQYPEAGEMYRVIKQFMAAHNIVAESSLVVGYPDKPNGQYSRSIKNAIRKTDAQAWGAAGTPTGGDSPKENPIKSKIPSLKEYLELTQFNAKKEAFRQKIEAVLNEYRRSN